MRFRHRADGVRGRRRHGPRLGRPTLPLACQSCAAHNRHAASFCGRCGAPMAHTVAATMAPGHVPPLACPSCAAHNRYAASFCGKCGASLAPVTVRDVTRAHIAAGAGPAALACPCCGAHNRQTASFCGGCGVPFAPVPAHETAVTYAATAPAAAAPTRSLPAWDGWVAVAVLALAAGALIRVFGIDGPAELLPAETAFLDAPRIRCVASPQRCGPNRRDNLPATLTF